MKLTRVFQEFFRSEQSSGIVLILSAAASIIITNSWLGPDWLAIWDTKVGFSLGDFVHLKHSIGHWINDGLMAVFFLLIGLEIERELYAGELSSIRHASLPIVAALGGMAVPAFLYFLFNRGTDTISGIGVPMATDIAFALGVLALLGKRVPPALKVFLAALAIIDDLGAIIIIAVFYVGSFSLVHFALAMGVFVLLLVLNRSGVDSLFVYLPLGVVMWYFMLESGVHATIAGVLLAFAIPFRRGGPESPSYHLQHFLHKPVAFLIMPIFAVANTGITLDGGWMHGLFTAASQGIAAGLVVGKPLGIVLFSLVAVKLGLSRLPDGVHWRQMLGVGFLGGIGFTMSIFITLLAFDAPAVVQQSKIAILASSLIAGGIGWAILRRPRRRQAHATA